MPLTPGFQNLAKLTHLGGEIFRLDEDLVYYSVKYNRVFVTPAGTLTDFASIPWFAQSFCQVLGKNIRSAIMHDFHCREEGKIANQVSQRMADELFREGMSFDFVRWSKARVMYRAVTTFQQIKYAVGPGDYDEIPEPA